MVIEKIGKLLLQPQVLLNNMKELAEEKARKEVHKLGQMNQFNPEAGYIRNYLDWLVALPWNKESKSSVDIKGAEKILNEIILVYRK